MRIGPAANVARLNVDETVSALWQFANALGLLTDDIGERTAAAGVTIDGLLVRDAGIPEAAVTAHEAALAILETQIADGSLLARLAMAETITALWVFSHASGLSTDDIVERSPGAGVNVEGVVLVAGSSRHRALAAATDVAVAATVAADPNDRFWMTAAGAMAWGPGSSGRDTNLFRAAANELATDDDFNVGGDLDLSGNIQLSERSPAQITANQNQYDTGDTTVQRLSTDASRSISGFAGGFARRVIVIANVGVNDLVLLHENAGSGTSTRMILPNAADLTLTPGESLTLWYDGNVARWRAIAQAV